MAIYPSQHGLIASFLPSACSEVSYAPGLLLDAGFDASITDHPDFSRACQDGFSYGLEEMYAVDEQGNEVFVGCSSPWPTIKHEIVFGVARRYDAGERFYEQKLGYFPSLSSRVGYMLGWLSALALVDPPLALQGLHLLSLLVPSCQYEETKQVYSRSVGLDGFHWICR